MQRSELSSYIKKISSQPGVYIFKDGAGQVLYVGKAIKLNDRLKSYLKPIHRGPKIIRMVQEATNLKVEETDSEIEAIILEANLISQFKPPFNTIGKDDKSASFIKINWSEQFPRLHLVRGRELDLNKDGKTNPHSHRQDKLFGPYAGIGMNGVLRVIRKIWPFRDCSPSKFKTYEKLGRGCLYAQIGLCDAPCVGEINEQKYRQNMQNIIDFLSGKKALVLEKMKEEMEKASLQEEYELAASLRDRISALENLREFAGRGVLRGFEENKERIKQGVKVEAYDISNMQGEFAVGVMVRASIYSDKEDISVADIVFTKELYKKFRIKTVKGANDVAMLDEVLKRRFARARIGSPQWQLPDLIILDGGLGQLGRIRATAKGLGITVPIVAVSKGKTRKRVDLHFRKQDEIKINYSTRQLKIIALTMREEAHRFAISYYRKTHRQGLRSSF